MPKQHIALDPNALSYVDLFRSRSLWCLLAVWSKPISLWIFYALRPMSIKLEEMIPSLTTLFEPGLTSPVLTVDGRTRVDQLI